MVGMAKDVADAMIELDNRKCLMSLLEYGDQWSDRTRNEGTRS
jgi:hypothetical protein